MLVLVLILLGSVAVVATLKIPGVFIAALLISAALLMLHTRPDASEQAALRSSIRLSAEDIEDVMAEYEEFQSSEAAEKLQTARSTGRRYWIWIAPIPQSRPSITKFPAHGASFADSTCAFARKESAPTSWNRCSRLPMSALASSKKRGCPLAVLPSHSGRSTKRMK